MNKIIITIFSLACILFQLTGCSQSSILYRVNVQQGNILTQEMVNQLHPGLTKEKVIDIMGPPVLNDTFSDNRWNYVFYYKPGKGKKVTRNYVVIYFCNNRVSRIMLQGKLE